MSENKVPCGGFRIGDGLAMDGDTLKSLGGAYIKVVPDEESPETFKIADDSPLNYETAMKYDGLIFMLLQSHGQQAVILLYAKKTNILRFKDYELGRSSIEYYFVEVHEDNSVHVITNVFTLTPAT